MARRAGGDRLRRGAGTAAGRQPAATDAAVAAITDLLHTLGTTAAGFNEASVPRPAGQLRTVAGFSGPTDSGRLADRITVPAGTRAFLTASSNRVAFRTGAVSVLVEASDDGTAITVRRIVSC